MIKIKKLFGNRVLLEPISPRTVTDSGIHLVERYQDDRMQYRVLAVGPGRKGKKGAVIAPEVQPGQRCLIPYIQDCVHLPDGTVVAYADQIQAVWG